MGTNPILISPSFHSDFLANVFREKTKSSCCEDPHRHGSIRSISLKALQCCRKMFSPKFPCFGPLPAERLGEEVGGSKYVHKKFEKIGIFKTASLVEIK